MSTEGQRQSQVGEQMGRLDDSINVAGESLEQLRERLKSYSQHDVTTGTKEVAAPVETLVPFASQIQDCVGKLVTLNDDIQSTILGLEI